MPSGVGAKAVQLRADRRDRRRGLLYVSRTPFLRPGKDHGNPDGVRHGPGIAAQERSGSGANAGLSAFRGHVGALWSDRSQLAGRGQEGSELQYSETPLFAGRAIAALAADPNLSKKSGRVFSSWDLSDEYGFCDAHGRRPHRGRYFVAKYGDCMKTCDDGFYEHWFGGPMDVIYANWP